VTLRTASRDAIWAVETDDDGLQSVVRYRVAPSKRSESKNHPR
jgi:hypothetical protein